MNGFSTEEDSRDGPPPPSAPFLGQTCCLIDGGERCARAAGNASFRKRVQKSISQKRLKLDIDKTNPMPNLQFYRNNIPFEPNGVYIDDLHCYWKDKYNILEKNHSYIQWLFPLQEHGMNHLATPLTPDELQEMKKDEEVRRRFLESYKLMLGFYGIQLVDDATGKVFRAINWEERFYNLDKNTHNNLRITRILKCLGEMGYEHYQAPLVRFFLEETLCHNNLPSVKQSVLDYFMFTVKNKAERKELVLFAWEQYEPKSWFIWGPMEVLRKLRPPLPPPPPSPPPPEENENNPEKNDSNDHDMKEPGRDDGDNHHNMMTTSGQDPERDDQDDDNKTRPETEEPVKMSSEGESKNDSKKDKKNEDAINTTDSKGLKNNTSWAEDSQQMEIKGEEQNLRNVEGNEGQHNYGSQDQRKDHYEGETNKPRKEDNKNHHEGNTNEPVVCQGDIDSQNENTIPPPPPPPEENDTPEKYHSNDHDMKEPGRDDGDNKDHHEGNTNKPVGCQGDIDSQNENTVSHFKKNSEDNSKRTADSISLEDLKNNSDGAEERNRSPQTEQLQTEKKSQTLMSLECKKPLIVAKKSSLEAPTENINQIIEHNQEKDEIGVSNVVTTEDDQGLQKSPYGKDNIEAPVENPAQDMGDIRTENEASLSKTDLDNENMGKTQRTPTETVGKGEAEDKKPVGSAGRSKNNKKGNNKKFK